MIAVCTSRPSRRLLRACRHPLGRVVDRSCRKLTPFEWIFAIRYSGTVGHQRYWCAIHPDALPRRQDLVHWLERQQRARERFRPCFFAFSFRVPRPFEPVDITTASRQPHGQRYATDGAQGGSGWDADSCHNLAFECNGRVGRQCLDADSCRHLCTG